VVVGVFRETGLDLVVVACLGTVLLIGKLGPLIGSLISLIGRLGPLIGGLALPIYMRFLEPLEAVLDFGRFRAFISLIEVNNQD
jgi:hypothetical protein